MSASSTWMGRGRRRSRARSRRRAARPAPMPSIFPITTRSSARWSRSRPRRAAVVPGQQRRLGPRREFLGHRSGVLEKNRRHQSLRAAQREPCRNEGHGGARLRPRGQHRFGCGRVGSSGEAVYSACKGGMIAFSKTMSRELVSKGIIINTLCRGRPTPRSCGAFSKTRRRQDRRRTEARDPDAAAGTARGLSRSRRVLSLRRRRLHHRPDHQRLGRFDDARIENGDIASWKNTRIPVRRARRRGQDHDQPPEKYNAFTAETCEELIDAFRRAGYDKSVAVIVLGSAGDKAFCTGADQSAHEAPTRAAAPLGCRSTNCSRSFATCRSR